MWDEVVGRAEDSRSVRGRFGVAVGDVGSGAS